MRQRESKDGVDAWLGTLRTQFTLVTTYRLQGQSVNCEAKLVSEDAHRAALHNAGII